MTKFGVEKGILGRGHGEDTGTSRKKGGEWGDREKVTVSGP